MLQNTLSMVRKSGSDNSLTVSLLRELFNILKLDNRIGVAHRMAG